MFEILFEILQFMVTYKKKLETIVTYLEHSYAF